MTSSLQLFIEEHCVSRQEQDTGSTICRLGGISPILRHVEDIQPYSSDQLKPARHRQDPPEHPRPAKIPIHPEMVEAVEKGEQLPVGGVENSEIREERSRQVVECHVWSNDLAISHEVEDVDVLVEFGEVIDVSQVLALDRIQRMKVKYVVQYQAREPEREDGIELAVQRRGGPRNREWPLALDIPSERSPEEHERTRCQDDALQRGQWSLRIAHVCI